MRAWIMVALLLAACEPTTDARVNMSPREQAEAAIGAVVEARGASFDGLPNSNMVAFGPLGYSYDPAVNQIVVSVLVTEFFAWTTYANRRPKIEATLAALDDPAIGGLFDTAGGAWNFDRKTGKLRLQNTHEVSASSSELLASTEALQSVYPEWSLSWLGEIGKIVHNGAPLPRQKVTVANNPYR